MAIIRNGRTYNEAKAKGIEAYLLTGKYYLAQADFTKPQKSLEAYLEIGYPINGYEKEL